MNANTIAFIAIILAALFGGGIPVVSKIALLVIPPFVYTILRFLIAFIVILPLLIREKPKPFRYAIKVFGVSLLGTANVTLFALGIRLTTASIAQMLYTTVPIVAGIFSYLILSEKITRRKIAGVFLGFLGTLIIILLPIIGKPSAFNGNIVGNILIFIAVISYSLYTTLSKTVIKKSSPIYLVAMLMMSSIIVNIVFMFFDASSFNGWWNHLTLNVTVSVLYVGIFGGTVYYLLYQYAIKHGTPLIASMTFYLQPTATFIIAALLLGEKLTMEFIVGAVITFFGAWIVTK